MKAVSLFRVIVILNPLQNFHKLSELSGPITNQNPSAAPQITRVTKPR